MPIIDKLTAEERNPPTYVRALRVGWVKPGNF
jgi:hypothetical protein